MLLNKNTQKIGNDLPSTQICLCQLGRMIKNQNFFVSPNKFAILANNDACENVSIPSNSSKSPNTIQDIDPPAPPIYLKNIANYSILTSINQTILLAASLWLLISPSNLQVVIVLTKLFLT